MISRSTEAGVTTYTGEVRNGVVVLPEGVALPEGTVVRVQPIEEVPRRSALAERLLRIAGTAEGLPEDLAENLDHYLHGRPRR